jgi:hypothetical protein
MVRAPDKSQSSADWNSPRCVESLTCAWGRGFERV